MNIPGNLRYSEDHEWLTTVDNGVATVGITEYAADALGDVVFVQLPTVGDTVRPGESCGEIESTKSVSELFAPAVGEVIEVNPAVEGAPELLNSDPYGEGWLFKLRIAEEPTNLLDAGAYTALVRENG